MSTGESVSLEIEELTDVEALHETDINWQSEGQRLCPSCRNMFPVYLRLDCQNKDNIIERLAWN